MDLKSWQLAVGFALQSAAHLARRRIFFVDLSDFDSLNDSAAFLRECRVARRHFPDPLDRELLQRDSEFA